MLITAMIESHLTMQQYTNAKSLASNLNKMAAADQAMRKKWSKTGKYDGGKTDIRNTASMKKIVTEYGWPTIKMVGKKASKNAWLLVQHADLDVQFQEKCLDLIQKEFDLNKENIDPSNIAYLTDRVMVNSKKKQMYGTQFRSDANGKLKSLPIQSLRLVDQLRKKLGMNTVAEYLEWASKEMKIGK
jgi:hypothetical protein